ncbi:glycerophosphodiester phosphodiesterase [Zooshikella ganghwensis]|uniref:Glycerophosphodiester phosphodiesterase n=1 Tax=Zooshikella ganghwensis TaxID=202772 RepID=A0A4P9VLZ6_9GAMM|nr:glycerophosphodiester phosphodiesterase family protein [Zooshikella ganghwensis]RDH44353.1 glycerophosphodiester phosphodiesterase [Zooshikella ganghwensis]
MLIIGHRGARNEAPENTLTGFRHAIDQGVRHFELDLRLSQDHQLVVIHDSTVNRTTNGQGRVAAHTYDQLRMLDARHGLKGWPQSAQIPSLSSLVEACPEIEHLQLELKADNRAEAYAVAEAAHQWLAHHQPRGDVVITSGVWHCLDYIQGLDRSYRLGAVIEHHPHPLRLAQSFNCQLLVLYHKRCNPTLVAEAKTNQLEVSTWTVNEAEDIQRVLDCKVDSIITDWPTRYLHLET